MAVDYEYIPCAKTAKILKQVLQRSFPGTKFSVVSDMSAWSASILVSYRGGPSHQEVSQIARQYSGGGFDGMIDEHYSRYAYLDDDGIVHGHDSEGTAAYRGSVQPVHDPQPPGTRKVQFGATYVHVQPRGE